MCSIAGILSSRPVDAARLREMNACMRHRGPDGEGYFAWNDESTWLHFAHNRLSILDTTTASAQPFRYQGRYTIVYNGEIYNYRELRQGLEAEGYAFRTTGDTEVLTAAYARWGEQCVDHFDGMFAFGIWDERDRTFFAARDRFGEKPFFYHYDSACRTLHFASGIRALLKAGIPDEPNHTLLYDYLTLGHTRQVHFPENTFYKHVFQLPPSHTLSFHVGKGEDPVVARYFDIDKETVHKGGEKEATERFAALLRTSVQRRMRSDVHTGTSLSGGLDSSAITALCHSGSDEQYTHQAFSAVFPGFAKDESAYIDEMESRFGLSVHRVSPTADDLADSFAQLVRDQEEPFGSASVFAQWKVFEKANMQGVTVLLDGQGADEALAGYTKYTKWYLQEMIHVHGWRWANEQAEAYRRNLFLEDWGLKNLVAAAFPALTAMSLARGARQRQMKVREVSREFRKAHADPDTVFKPVVEKLNDMQYHDLMTMGLEELLRYADRNSMAHSREVRLPFLSHELVQFVISLPADLRMRDGFTKWILRKSMENLLPENITWRKGKTGFEPPQKAWMQAPAVRELIHAGRKRLVDQRILDPSVLETPIVPAGAHEAGNFDLRCMVAGQWIEGAGVS